MNNNLTDYDQEMITALYRTIGYLGEQGTSTPEIRRVLCDEITKIEDKAKATQTITKQDLDDLSTTGNHKDIRIEKVEEIEEEADWLDFNCKASPCHY